MSRHEDPTDELTMTRARVVDLQSRVNNWASRAGTADRKRVKSEARVAELQADQLKVGRCLTLFRNQLANGLGVPADEHGLPDLIQLACERLAELKQTRQPIVDFIRRVIDSEGLSFARHCVQPPPDWLEDREDHRKEAEDIVAQLRGEGVS